MSSESVLPYLHAIQQDIGQKMRLIRRAQPCAWRQKGSCRRTLVAAAEDIGLINSLAWARS